MATLSLLFNNLKMCARICPSVLNQIHQRPLITQNPFSIVQRLKSTTVQDKLMAFFDEEKNWGYAEIKVGRAWTADELRIKSNTDLHKLWYILLKERNMLLTMEHECKSNYKIFANPERIDKVKESMDNVEKVVKERNAAYYLLETGENGQRPVKQVYNQIGLKNYYAQAEHVIPRSMNKKWRESRVFRYSGHAVKKFLLLYNEKKFNIRRKAGVRDNNHVIQLLKRFPNMDKEKLKAAYPNVDIDKAMRQKKAQGHFIPKEFQ